MATHFRRYRLKQYMPVIPTTEQQYQRDAANVIREAEHRKSLVHDSVIPLRKESSGDVWKFVAQDTKEFIQRVDPISELGSTNHILIKKAGKDFRNYFMNMNCSWELLNSQGKRIFFACETLFDWKDQDVDINSFWKNQPVFDIILVGANGGGALNIIAHMNKTSVSAELEYIGEILCTTTIRCQCWPWDSYKVQDCRAKNTYKIKYFEKSKVDGLPPNFRIIDEKTGIIVGKITNEWTFGELPQDELWNKYYGVSFCDAVPLNSRMLLVGAFFTIIGTKGFYAVNHVLENDLQEAEHIARKEESRRIAAANVRFFDKRASTKSASPKVSIPNKGGNPKLSTSHSLGQIKTSKKTINRWGKLPQAIKKNQFAGSTSTKKV